MPKHTTPSRVILAAKADIVEGKCDDDKREMSRVNILANTGNKMNIRGYYDPVILDMAGGQFEQTMPIFEDHDPTKRVGHTTSVALGKNSHGALTQLRVEGVVSGTGPSAQAVLADAQNGFPFQASVGADIIDAVYIDKGQSTEVNGKMQKGPLIVARKWSLYEVTVTPLGADSRTRFSVAASAAPDANVIGVSSMGFDEFLSSLGLSRDDLTEDQLSSLQAKHDDGFRLQAAADVDDQDDQQDQDDQDQDDQDSSIQAARDTAIAEEERIDEIRRIAARKDFRQCKGRIKARNKAIKDGWTPERFELELHRNHRPEPGQFQVHAKQQKPTDRRVVECSLLMASGQLRDSDLTKLGYSQEEINDAVSSEYRGYGLHRLMHETISAAGMHYRPGQYDNDFIRMMKQADSQVQAAGDFSTVDVSGILSNIQNKILLNAFSSSDPALNIIAATGSVRDFKTMTGYRMTGIGEFTQVSPTGEIKDMSLGEESYEIQALTYGAKLGLSRTDIINDDLGAFARIPRTIGRAAKMKLHDVAFNEFLDDAAFFTAGNNNLLTGAGSAFDIDALSNAVQQFMRQEDINGKPIDIIPAVLLTGTKNAVAAQQVFNEAKVIMETHSTGSARVRPQNNPHVNKYTPVSTRWTDAGVTSGGNGNDDYWWLLSNDPDTACLEVRYLNGVATPTIEQQRTAPDVLGMLWVGYFDFGVSKKEFRGGVKNEGA